MKRILILSFALFLFSCEDENENTINSNLVGTWNLSNMGEYENAANCSGAIDNTGWALAQAFGMTGSLEFKAGGSGTITVNVLGMSESGQFSWSEGKNEFCVGGECIPFKVEGNTLSYDDKQDAYCEDNDGNETSQSSESSCNNAGNTWYDASLSLIHISEPTRPY